jgi:N-acetylmuramoyl-L-alanine amidase
MSKFLKLALPILIILSLLSIIYLQGISRSLEKISRRQVKLENPPRQLSSLASPPDWKSLAAYQNTITRQDFERLLTRVFTTGNAWRDFIEISEESARIKIGSTPAEEFFLLDFATLEKSSQISRHWRTTAELPPSPPEKPLTGLKIAIDPGHIGGEWAKIEERWFVVGAGTPVSEGEMTLKVANLLKPKLEALGATVSLVREKLKPITAKRPDSFLSLAKDSGDTADSPAALQRLAERLFYRTAEIHARADLVNQSIKPDLVLCLHFNAEAWGDPNQPTLIDRTHLHLILNGAYTDEEVMLEDHRFALLQKILRRTHEEEVLVGSTVAKIFSEMSGLPPYTYPINSTNVREIEGQPYLWARNLLANRLYDCPVVFMEPYVMNSTIDHARIQAGDYEGLREIAGKLQPSIFQEYATALAQGLAVHYRNK